MATLPPNNSAPLISTGLGVFPSPEVNCPWGARIVPLKLLSFSKLDGRSVANQVEDHIPTLITKMSLAPPVIVIVECVPVPTDGTLTTFTPPLDEMVKVP